MKLFKMTLIIAALLSAKCYGLTEVVLATVDNKTERGLIIKDHENEIAKIPADTKITVNKKIILKPAEAPGKFFADLVLRDKNGVVGNIEVHNVVRGLIKADMYLYPPLVMNAESFEDFKDLTDETPSFVRIRVDVVINGRDSIIDLDVFSN